MVPTTTAIEPRWIRKPRKTWSFTRDWKRFEGEYVAKVDDLIISHGCDPGKVMDEAETYHERPVLAMIPEGGWAHFLWSDSPAK